MPRHAKSLIVFHQFQPSSHDLFLFRPQKPHHLHSSIPPNCTTSHPSSLQLARPSPHQYLHYTRPRTINHAPPSTHQKRPSLLGDRRRPRGLPRPGLPVQSHGPMFGHQEGAYAVHAWSQGRAYEAKPRGCDKQEEGEDKAVGKVGGGGGRDVLSGRRGGGYGKGMLAGGQLEYMHG